MNEIIISLIIAYLEIIRPLKESVLHFSTGSYFCESVKFFYTYEKL